MTVEVINGKTHGFLGRNKIYIGRKNKAYHLKESVLHNQFTIGRDGDRSSVIAKYQEWLKTEVKRGLAGQESPVFNELVRITNLVRQGESIQLCCWCHPQPCHGDVIKTCIEWTIDIRFK
jgi:Domain of unknown function (DUF4326)